jgi:lipopolysaccharide transport system permease protein
MGQPNETQEGGNARAASTTSHSAPRFVLEPSRGWVPLQLGSLWEYRELFYFLAWRDVKVRYKQTAIGIAWAVLQPVLTMLIFSLFFGYLANMPSDGLPYPVFAYTALLPWQLFAYALSASANSLVMNQALIAKVYFPRLVVPLAAVVVGLVDFGFSLLVLFGLMYYYGLFPTAAILTIPLFVGLAIAAALAVGVWLSALNVQYRDVQFTIPFLTQCWLFATPIAYSSSLIPEPWRVWYGLNPMVGVVEGFRWALLGQSRPLEHSLLLSILVTGALLIGGLVYFRRMERTFADVV